MSNEKQYRVLTGMDYTVGEEHKRAEVGDIVTDLPSGSVKWLQDDGHIEVVRPSRKGKGKEGGTD